MDLIDIISVSPVNPAHGRHEVHAKNYNGVPVTFTISPGALGSLTGYLELYTITPQTFDNFLEMFKKAEKELLNTKES